jgi:hypothetical protein
MQSCAREASFRHSRSQRPALIFVVSFFPSLREDATYSVERAKTEVRICKSSLALRSREFEAQ